MIRGLYARKKAACSLHPWLPCVSPVFAVVCVASAGNGPRKEVKIYYFNLRKEVKEGKESKQKKEKMAVMTPSPNKIHWQESPSPEWMETTETDVPDEKMIFWL
ncbi:unnamed protein product [Durusdinium trenchii]|uniref:Secreted protein n=1 Tax=Durusdinium trenchii TaxID=1381693 RepID=A0ABP0JKH6_9DINO